MDWPTFISAIGVNGLLIWFIQLYFKYQTDKEIKRVENEHNKEIKRLESELSRQHFTYSQVFKTTEIVIHSVYKKLLLLRQAGDKITHTGKTIDFESMQHYEKVFDDFWEYYLPNKIYVPPKTTKAIVNFCTFVNAAKLQYGIAKHAVNMGDLPQQDGTQFKSVFDEYFKTSQTIPALLESLEKEFQDVLGFPKEDKQEEVIKT